MCAFDRRPLKCFFLLKIKRPLFYPIYILIFFNTLFSIHRDRKRIKERIEAKRRQRLENSAFDNPQNENYQHSHVNGTPPSPTKEKTTEKSMIRQTNDVTVIVHNNIGRTNSSEISQERGKALKQSRSRPTSHSSNVYEMTGDSLSRNMEYKQYTQHNPIIASRNTLRRMSYDVAVGEFSFLNQEPPKYASSNSITNVYTYGNTRPVVVFDNKAYDGENQI